MLEKRGLIDIEIKSVDVKNAVLKAIKIKYPEATFYAEIITQPVYPNFFISFVQVVTERIGHNLYRFWFYISVQYKEASEPTQVGQLNQKLAEVGDNLNDILQYLEIYDTKTACIDVKQNIVDNILQAFCTLKLIGSLPVKIDPIMETLEYKEEIK